MYSYTAKIDHTRNARRFRRPQHIQRAFDINPSTRLIVSSHADTMKDDLTTAHCLGERVWSENIPVYHYGRYSARPCRVLPVTYQNTGIRMFFKYKSLG